MLDEQVRAFLEAEAARGVPAYPDVGPVEARRLYGLTAAARWAGAPVPPVGAVEDRAVAGVPVRVYRPLSPPAAPALVVYLHGGGWVVGDVATYDPVARTLCARTRAVVVSVEYRLAPEHPYPAALDDATAVATALPDVAAGLGVDRGRLAVAGDSAGGGLAAAVALRLRAGGGPALRAQALVYPALDARLAMPSVAEHAEGYGLTAATMRWYVDQYLPPGVDRDDPLASPAAARDLAGLPPALVVTAEHDVLRDEGEDYAARLRAAGVPVTLVREPGLVHGFLGTAGVLPPARAAAERTWDALVPLLAA